MFNFEIIKKFDMHHIGCELKVLHRSYIKVSVSAFGKFPK